MRDIDAIDNYILWELCKQKGIQEEIMKDSSNGKKLKQMVEKVQREYLEKEHGFDEKLEKLHKLDNNPDYRLKTLEEHSWEKETVATKDLGTTLPRAGDLPPEIITGKLPEVVEFVRNSDPKEYRSVKYIKKLKKVPEILNEFYPWVIHPKNRQEKRQRLDKIHGEKDWEIKETWGMINDGNHRAIAKILANNSKEIDCFVGRPKNYN